jgi:hypothetical protein
MVKHKVTTLGSWIVRHDPLATLENQADYSCTCLFCQNLRAQPDAAFPASLRELLEELGLSPGREREMSCAGSVKSGVHLYLWEYEFVGTVEKAGDGVSLAGTVSVDFWQYPRPLADGRPHALLRVSAQLPWVLEHEAPG